MSSSLETERLALSYLKGKENPFDSLARPQRLDDRFQDLHVPELLADERSVLLDIIDSYRVEEYERSSDLRPTRVVTVRGDRGSGKTHLLQSLAYRGDGKSQLLVRPSYYEPHLPIEEFLLAQLMAGLAAKDEAYRSRPIEDIAAALTRRLLRQALRGLGPTERLFALSPTGWQRWRLLFGETNRECQGLNRLIDDLEKADAASNLHAFLQRNGLGPRQGACLIQGHLNRHEAGTDLLAVLRRKLYAAMAQSVLLRDNDPLSSLLEGEYSDLGTSSTTRAETVARLLHAVTEVCSLVRQPIVFAFDNLERLFMPQNQFDGELVRVFFNSLAQAVDNTKGLLILLFAESGLFEQAAKFIDAFAQDRLEQGVPTYGRGPTNMIRLKSPRTKEIGTLVKNRVGEALAGFDAADGLPESFPFAENDLASAATDHQSLRNTLRRLRDRYSAHVYEQAVVESRPPTAHWESLLESHWHDQFKAASRKLEGGLTGHLQSLHAGLGAILNPLVPLALDSWQLTDVQPTALIGDNPTYGVVSLITWSRTAAANGEESSLKVGVGFLLARGPGMPHDLRAKLDFFRRPRKGHRLLVLWPTASDREDLVEALPRATREAWDASRHKNDVSLRRLGNDELCTLLAIPDWLNAAQAAADQPPPPEAVQAFIKEKFQSLLQLIAPQDAQVERVVADED